MNCNCQRTCRCPDRYGFFNFIWDIIMILATAGFWIIWIFVREMRKQR